jgi:hypothetical protein
MTRKLSINRSNNYALNGEYNYCSLKTDFKQSSKQKSLPFDKPCLALLYLPPQTKKAAKPYPKTDYQIYG